MRNLFPVVVSAVTLLGGAETLLSQVDLVPVASGFSSPIAVTGAGDGSGRLFIVEQAGLIRIWDGTAVLEPPFLDISGLVDDEGGEIYLADHGGTIYRLRVPVEIFSDGFESGDTTLWSPPSP